MPKVWPYVLCGGAGTRLWPLSREDNPKQFHDLAGNGSMLARTIRRLAARPAGSTPIYLIAAERHAGRVRADLAAVELQGGGAIFEPVGKGVVSATEEEAELNPRARSAKLRAGRRTHAPARAADMGIFDLPDLASLAKMGAA